MGMTTERGYRFRSGSRLLISFGLMVLVLLLVGYVEATNSPDIKDLRIDSEQVGKPIKAILISDLHVADPGTSISDIENLVAIINEQKPDIVFIAGDFVSTKRIATRKYDFKDISKKLEQIKSRLGIYAVLGNHDHWKGSAQAKIILEQSGIAVLDNEAVKIENMVVGGVDDAFTGHADVTKTLEEMEKLKGYRILLSHSPDVMPAVDKRVSLVLSGHTHCGQIALPYIGPIITMSRYGKKYACGVIRENGKILVVSSGIGTSLVPIRLGARPDIWVIDIF